LVYPTKSTGTKEVLEKVEEQASRIVTDRGTAYTSGLFNEYCNREGIQHLPITTGVPRGNGQVERIQKIVIPILSKMCKKYLLNWYRHVDRAQQITNNTPPRTTKYSPFQVLTGLNMRKRDDEFSKLFKNLEIEDLNDKREEM